MSRTATYQPALAWFALIGSLWVFVLVALGAFTTTIGAGMVFSDWPLSNGSINPHGWLENVAMFAEHSHRLSGMVMGLITLSLAGWLQLREERRWLRRLGWWALGIVIAQGLIGGKRVLFDALAVPGFDMTVGQMLRIPHGILAQVYVCVLFAIAGGLSRTWIEKHGGARSPASPGLRALGRWCLLVLFIQLSVAVAMRHNFAGMAIPTFPFSTPDGHLLPAYWNYLVSLQFAHRALAALLGVMLSVFGFALLRNSALVPALRIAGLGLIVLVAAQITLGAYIIWTYRSVTVTTGHVVLGALTLASSFLVTVFIHRDAIETPAPGQQ